MLYSDAVYLWDLRDASLLETCWIHVSIKHHLYGIFILVNSAV